MQHELYIDTETFSDIPLKYGTHAYAQHVQVMLVGYALDDGPANCWDRANGEPMPSDLDDALDDSDVLLNAHNSFFDRTVMNADGFGLVYDLRIPRWRCTMAQAFAHGLPGKLETLGAVLGLPTEQQKMKEGRELINLFCKPRPKNSVLRRATRDTHPAEWETFVEYAARDVESMRETHKRMPRWNYPDNPRELELWFLDQEINDRGVRLDLELAQAAVRATTREKIRLAAETSARTEELVESATQRDRLLGYLLAEHGVSLPDLQAATLERRVSDTDLPRELRELLQIRLESSMTSHTKYKTALNCASPDERARGLLQFAGAQRTQRWAGRVLQPQNFVRPTLHADEIELGIRALKADVEWML